MGMILLVYRRFFFFPHLKTLEIRVMSRLRAAGLLDSLDPLEGLFSGVLLWAFNWQHLIVHIPPRLGYSPETSTHFRDRPKLLDVTWKFDPNGLFWIPVVVLFSPVFWSNWIIFPGIRVKMENINFWNGPPVLELWTSSWWCEQVYINTIFFGRRYKLIKPTEWRLMYPICIYIYIHIPNMRILH